MNKESQYKIMIKKLIQNGYVKNSDFLERKIIRLGSLIHESKSKEGLRFYSCYYEGGKNCFYIVEKWGDIKPATKAKIEASLMLDKAIKLNLRNMQK